jgi:hypothetical protein
VQLNFAAMTGSVRPLAYKRLDRRTQHVRRQILKAAFYEPIAPKSDRFFRDFPLAKMNANSVEILRDRKLSMPEAANGRVKAIRQVFKWAVPKGHAPFNPAREVSYFKSGSEGFHTWTAEEVQQFEERHPIGTKARLTIFQSPYKPASLTAHSVE